MWRSEWEIRRYSWDNFKSTCEGCVINDARYYCASRCPAMSHARNEEFFGCGASDFEILSTITRTAMLEATETGQESGKTIAEIIATQRMDLPSQPRSIPLPILSNIN